MDESHHSGNSHTSQLSMQSSSMGLQRIMKVRTVQESRGEKQQNNKQKERSRIRHKLRVQESRSTSSENENVGSTVDGIDANLPLSVSFDKIEIREYPIILGDHPDTTTGPPLTIDWEYSKSQECIDIDEYEKTRPTRRNFAEMNMPPPHRVECLMRCGVTMKDINKRVSEVKVYRAGRLETTANLYRSQTHEKVEKMKRGLGNFFSGKKKKERELMEKSKMFDEMQRNEEAKKLDIEEQALSEFIRDNAKEIDL